MKRVVFFFQIDQMSIWKSREIYRRFHTSIIRWSIDVFHVQDEDDFQKQIIESKKLFMVGFHAHW